MNEFVPVGDGRWRFVGESPSLNDLLTSTPKDRRMNRAEFGIPTEVTPFGYLLRWTHNDPACPHLVALDRDGIVVDYLGAAAKAIKDKAPMHVEVTVVRGRRKTEVSA